MGKALAEGARPDYVHIFGSPGIGVDSLDELSLEGKTVVTVTSNLDDPVVSWGPHGEMPPHNAISYPPIGNPKSDDYNAHRDYFDPVVLADIVSNRRQPDTVEE